MLDRTPGSSRYAYPECERRFLLARVPPSAHSAVEITDRYLDGTTLRLRRMRARNGRLIHKLGQKVRPNSDDPSVVLMTNIYLSEAEHSTLTSVPSAWLEKTRFRLEHDGCEMAVDFFHGHLEGLILAEASFVDVDEMGAFPAPEFAVADVTADDRYTGGALARADPDALPDLLAAARQPVEWAQWHDAYSDPDSPLSRRLTVVQAHIRRSLDTAPDGPIRAVCLCAGEGSDLLPVLAEHPRRGDMEGRLVERDPGLAERARERARDLGLTGVEVLTADAAEASAYASSVPAQLVMVCGVFGNLTNDDVRHTISRLPMLCAPAATVMWTRHRQPPDLTPAIRRWFTESGFEEVAFDSPGSGAFGVGCHRLAAEPAPLAPEVRLFTFVR